MNDEEPDQLIHPASSMMSNASLSTCKYPYQHEMVIDPTTVVDTAFQLWGIQVLTDDQMKKATREMRPENREVMRAFEKFPDVTDAQMQAAQAVIPSNY